VKKRDKAASVHGSEALDIRSSTNPAFGGGASVSGTDRRSERFVMISRRDVFYRGGLLKARYMVDEKTVPSASCPELYSSKVLEDEEDAEERRCCGRYRASRWCRWSTLSRKIKTIIDFSIFTSLVFDYFCFHTLLLFFTYDIPYVYIPDAAATHDIGDTKASFLVSIIGICSTVGQVSK
jgi:hypothetical protein